MTSTAGGGTLTLEFGVLSRLTGDPGEDLTVLILKVYDELFQRTTVMGISQRCDEMLTDNCLHIFPHLSWRMLIW